MGYYVKNILHNKSENWLLNTTAGQIYIHAVTENNFEVQMTGVVELPSKHGFFCNTGVPHLVLEIKRLADYPEKKEMARALRSHPDFGSAGTNVTFIEFLPETFKVKAVSFERGVEDFTAACGTGAMAAAFYNLKKQKCAKTEVEMPGGMLIMDVSDLTKPIMTGSAVALGEFSYEI